MSQSYVQESEVTEEKAAAFVDSVNNESFITADIADVMDIRQEEDGGV